MEEWEQRLEDTSLESEDDEELEGELNAILNRDLEETEDMELEEGQITWPRGLLRGNKSVDKYAKGKEEDPAVGRDMAKILQDLYASPRSLSKVLGTQEEDPVAHTPGQNWGSSATHAQRSRTVEGKGDQTVTSRSLSLDDRRAARHVQGREEDFEVGTKIAKVLQDLYASPSSISRVPETQEENLVAHNSEQDTGRTEALDQRYRIAKLDEGRDNLTRVEIVSHDTGSENYFEEAGDENRTCTDGGIEADEELGGKWTEMEEFLGSINMFTVELGRSRGSRKKDRSRGVMRELQNLKFDIHYERRQDKRGTRGGS